MQMSSFASGWLNLSRIDAISLSVWIYRGGGGPLLMEKPKHRHANKPASHLLAWDLYTPTQMGLGNSNSVVHAWSSATVLARKT